MKNNNLIFDFETLGTNVIKGFPVLEGSIGNFDYSRFVSDNPYTFEGLITQNVKKLKLDVRHQMKEYGLKPEPETMAWWKSQDQKVQDKVLKPLPNDLTVNEFCDKFLEYVRANIGKVNYWWTRGNTFDPIVIQFLFMLVGREAELYAVLKFWLVRDIRSHIDAKFDYGLPSPDPCPFEDQNKWNAVFEKHNSIHDVAADILRLQRIVRIENGLERNADR